MKISGQIPITETDVTKSLHEVWNISQYRMVKLKLWRIEYGRSNKNQTKYLPTCRIIFQPIPAYPNHS